MFRDGDGAVIGILVGSFYLTDYAKGEGKACYEQRAVPIGLNPTKGEKIQPVSPFP